MPEDLPSGYEEMLRELYEGFLRPGDNAIDVGAHVGHHTFPIARCVSPGGRVLAFEPLEACRARIESGIAEAGLESTVSVFPFAVGAEDAETEFVVAVDALAYSGLRERVYDSPTRLERHPVLVRTLDGFASDLKHLEYIKIDVEGGEYDVVRGARSLILGHRPVVSFEFGLSSFGKYGISGVDMALLWTELRYALFDIRGRRFRAAEEFATSAVRQEVWDYIAVPEERTSATSSLHDAVSRRASG